MKWMIATPIMNLTWLMICLGVEGVFLLLWGFFVGWKLGGFRHCAVVAYV